MKILIIGGVAAGAKAAAKARRELPDAEINLYTDDTHISYSACGLPYFIEGNFEDYKLLLVRSPEDFEEKNVHVYLKHRAVKIIPEGSTVFITIGTTVEKIASVLVEKSALRVITDSLRVASILYRNPNIEVIVPAGSIRHTNGGIEGPKAIADLGEFRADFAITSIGAIDQDGTLLDFNLSEVIAAKTMISNAKQLIIACDHSKFTAAASIRLGHLKQASYLVTDIRPKEEIMSSVEDNHIVLVNPEIDI